ncbi:MAG TPA: hypothetical protein PKE30_20845 [Niabella sp.]|nr:hypothetical protein [Niabella sp.]
MKKVCWLLVAIVAMTLSCKKDKETNSSVFAGKWSGQYAGSDQGTWNVTVSGNGIISGTGKSVQTGRTFDMQGNVSNDGSFKATIGTVATGSEFTGKLTGQGTASGTWTNTITTPPQSGTWSGKRE